MGVGVVVRKGAGVVVVVKVGVGVGQIQGGGCVFGGPAGVVEWRWVVVRVLHQARRDGPFANLTTSAQRYSPSIADMTLYDHFLWFHLHAGVLFQLVFEKDPCTLPIAIAIAIATCIFVAILAQAHLSMSRLPTPVLPRAKARPLPLNIRMDERQGREICAMQEEDLMVQEEWEKQKKMLAESGGEGWLPGEEEANERKRRVECRVEEVEEEEEERPAKRRST